MSIRRAIIIAAVAVLLLADVGWAQFQQQMIQPFGPGGGGRRGRGERGRRFGAVPMRLYLASSCLDYGIRPAGPEEVYASVNSGHGFLIGGLPGGGQERLDLSDAIRTGQAVLRGTGRPDQVLLEVLAPGWSDLEIRPGLQALPPGGREARIPKPTLATVKEAAALEEEFSDLPSDARGLIERVLARGRQEHLWAVRSASWRTLNAGFDPLQAAVEQVRRFRTEPTAGPRLEWILRRPLSAEERELIHSPAAGDSPGGADLAFLGNFTVLRLERDQGQGPPMMERCTRAGVKRFPLTHAGVRSFGEALAGHAGHVLLTFELLQALDKAGLTSPLENTLAEAGCAVAWCLPDDFLLVQPFRSAAEFRPRFAVIAPQNTAQAKVLFGSSTRAAFAFKELVDQGLVQPVGSVADLQRLADLMQPDERIVLVCAQRGGRTLLPDGTQFSLADLPAGVAEIIAADAFSPAEQPPMDAMQPGALTFDALAEGVRAVVAAAADGGLLTAEQMVENLSVGLKAHLKRRRVTGGPVLKWGRTVDGHSFTVGADGTILKVMGRTAGLTLQAAR